MTRQTVTIIYFQDNGKRKYVSELPLRWDDKYLAIYSDDKAAACQFENEEEARAKIDRIVNYNGRDFKTMSTEVKVSTRNPFTAKSKDAFIN